jgi:hypothetical protein
MNMASGSSSKPGTSDKGVPFLSTATGVDPVVSTVIPAILSVICLPKPLRAPLTDLSSPSV